MESTGRYRTVSALDAVSNAKEMLSIEMTNEYDTFLLKKVNEGLVHLRSNDQIGEYQKDFDIVDGKVCLPDGFDSLLGFVFLDENDCPVYFGGYGSRVDRTAFRASVPFVTWGFKVLPNDGGIILFDCPEKLPGDRVRIMWEGRLTDDCGIALMHEIEERAAVAYACWRFSQKFPDKYPRDVRQEHKQDYANQKRFIQADAVYNAYRQNKGSIQRMMSAYLIFQRFGLS
jgi:hypothetical protein